MLLTKLANQEIVSFLRTVTIKNGYFADQLLKALVNEQYWRSLPEDRNPYYMHLAGKYILAEDMKPIMVTDPSTGIKYKQTYSSTFRMPNADGSPGALVRNAKVYTEAAFDEMMYVTSLDTQEIIPFTRENLHGDADNPTSAVHKKTLEAYRIPGRFFDMLCKKYPKQVDLIKSIVYLVPPKELSDVERSLYGGALPSEDERRFARIKEAKHLEILNYDITLLESREQQCMLDTIRKSLELIKTRWDIKEFSYEENYANVQWAMIWSLLPLILVSQRYANIRTPQVHSSHIWDYLTSNGLDSYRGYLSSEQEWFLYKNIKFLKENSGQNRILNILIDNLLADYNLHIESKTVVMDKTNILEAVDMGSNYSDQCANCARRSFCLKGVDSFKCTEFLGIKDVFKPEPVILTDELSGARKERILALLKTRYDCTDTEAEERYDRSFVWKDEAIELIKAELDRNQVVDMSGITEELSDVIYRAHESGLEPIFTDSIVAEQRNDLRHVKSTYLPTKLLEITEDPIEPAYDDMFTKFVTDTILHLAPQVVDNTVTTRVTESYSITVGQEGLSFIFNFSELLAALYLGFIKEFGPEMRVDINTGTEESPIWTTNYLTNFREFQHFAFKIPSRASLGFTFKLGTPVKQQDLVDAYEMQELIPGVIDLVTNKDETTKIAEIRGITYAISRHEKDNENNDVWEDYDYIYSVIGSFKRIGDDYYYSENTGEIGIIPRYFRWHYDHLKVQSFRNWDELNEAIPRPADGVIAATWETNSVWIGDGGAWREASITERKNISDVTFEVKPPTPDHPDVTPITVISALVQNRIVKNAKGEEYFIDEDGNPAEECKTFESFRQWTNDATATVFERCELSHYVDVDWILDNLWVDFNRIITKQDDIGEYFEKMFSIFERLDMIRTSCGDIKTKLAVKTFLESVLIDQRNVFGKSSSNQDWFDRKRKTYNFKLVVVGDNPSPTYEDWFNFNSEIGNNIRKMNESSDSFNLWNEFNTKLYEQLMRNCGLTYATSAADKTRYYKLKALVKSLSSYLINFIDNASSTRVSTEISHIAENSPAHQLESESYVDFDPVGQADIVAPIVDVEKPFYIPSEDTVAREGVQYYMHDVRDGDDGDFVESFSAIYNESTHTWTTKPTVVGDNLMSWIKFTEVNRERHKEPEPYTLYFVKDDSEQMVLAENNGHPTEFKDDTIYYERISMTEPLRYIKVDLKEILGIKDERLKVWHDENGWFYSTGIDVQVEGSNLNDRGEIESYARLAAMLEEGLLRFGDFYKAIDTNENYVVWEVNGVKRLINVGRWNGLEQTYPADPNVVKIMQSSFTADTVKLLSGKNSDRLSSNIYLKYASKIMTIWSEGRTNDQLSEYMDRSRRSHEITSTIVDPVITGPTQVPAFINSDNLDQK